MRNRNVRVAFRLFSVVAGEKVQRRAASSRYWAMSNSTHIRQARREKARSIVTPIARHTQFRDDAEFKEATSTLRHYAEAMKGVFFVDINAALRLLNWMMEMGNENSHDKFAAKCKGMYSQ